MEENEITGTWFATDLVVPANITTMVTLLTPELRELLHTLLTADEILSLVDRLKALQDELWEKNRRTKMVKIYCYTNSYLTETHGGICLGDQVTLRLIKVRERVPA